MKTREAGETVALRGMYQGAPWYIQSMLVIHDRPDEVALLLLPGAECAAPTGYIHQKHGDHSKWNRWQDIGSGSWKMEKYLWRTNRFLVLLEPERFFATYYIWNHTNHQLECYYINFQLPFTRSHCGFDTFDLELDIVIKPDFHWRWKDQDDYIEGIQLGMITPEWVEGIEKAREDILGRLQKRSYPLDGSWLNWFPQTSWPPPGLPDEWDRPT